MIESINSEISYVKEVITLLKVMIALFVKISCFT